MSKLYIKTLSILITLSVLLLLPFSAKALPLDTYAEKSALASGNWVKISIKESGIHLLTNDNLRRMGFSDPSKVRVYGYGAMRLPEQLSTNYIDDMPLVQSVTTSRGIFFYAVGPVAFESISSTRYRQNINPFSEVGYYFLSDSDIDERDIPLIGSPVTLPSAKTTFTETVYHESELINPGRTGHQLLGEDFKTTKSRTFNFDLPDNTSSTINIECAFAAASTAQSYFTLSVDGNILPRTNSDNMSAVSEHTHYSEAVPAKSYTFANGAIPEKTAVGVTYVPSGAVSLANLNYLTINYTRSLRLRSLPQFMFVGNTPAMELGDANEATYIWDVTDPLAIGRINGKFQENSKNFANTGSVGWINEYSGVRRYVAWTVDGASFPAPEYVGTVSNQNIHAEEVPDMIIFAPSAWLSQAERLAQFHRTDEENPLNVLVLDQQLVFNEFASGVPDAQAFRKVLKMFYDRSTDERRLQYVLFFGRGIYDNRRITAATKSLPGTYMPIWESEKGNSDSFSYTTDDIFAFLLDGSGVNTASDAYCVAVGRMPVISLSEATYAVDKLLEYVDSKHGEWQNRILLIADDQDSGVHMNQTETMWNNMMNSSGGQDINYTKIYTDAYEMVGGGYPGARTDMFRTLDEGVVWWTYIGHANTTSWTHENLLTYTDFNNLSLKYYPIIYAATCDFLRIDSNDKSAAEIVWLLQSGGAIGVISANRPVFISDNGDLSRSFGSEVFRRDKDGRRQTIGQVYMNAKNGVREFKYSDSNKLRYLLVGDPAMYPHIPDYRVVVDRINGIDPNDPDEQAIIKARQDVVIEGHLEDGNGNAITGFDGLIDSTIYDAEFSTVSRGNGDTGKSVTYEQQGNRIYAGTTKVTDGQFSLNVAMPSEISNNFREAAISFLFKPSDGKFVNQAVGMNRNFYVYGIDDTAPTDTIPPTIKSFYINHPSFKDGQIVNRSPMVIAEIEDNRGINMSNAGVGHQMTLQLDGKTTYSDVARFYIPATDGSSGGTLIYPFEDIPAGDHTLRLRIWDTDGNSCSQTISFFAKDGVTPRLYDVYTDCNPVSTQANFYLSHDRPDQNIEVTIFVYNLLGQPVWSSTSTARSDMYLTYPVVWNLTDNAGRRVPRGIYLYRAHIKADGQESETLSHKIAVTAQ